MIHGMVVTTVPSQHTTGNHIKTRISKVISILKSDREFFIVGRLKLNQIHQPMS